MFDALFALYGIGFLMMLGHLVVKAWNDPLLCRKTRIGYPLIGATLWPYVLYRVVRS